VGLRCQASRSNVIQASPGTENDRRSSVNQAVQIIIGGIVQGCVFALIALGLSLIYRVTGIINLAQGAFCIFGALLGYTFQVIFNWPMPLAMLAAVAGTTVFGLVIARCTAPSWTSGGAERLWPGSCS